MACTKLRHKRKNNVIFAFSSRYEFRHFQLFNKIQYKLHFLTKVSDNAYQIVSNLKNFNLQN